MTDVLGPKPPRSRARLWVATLLLLVYAGFVALVTLWPNPSDLEFGGIADRVLNVLYRFGVPESFGFDELEFTANIGMFVPLGFFLGLALPRRGWWLALFLVPGYSGFIEFTQATALESRVSSISTSSRTRRRLHRPPLRDDDARHDLCARPADHRACIWERDAEIIRARQHPLPQQRVTQREPDRRRGSSSSGPPGATPGRPDRAAPVLKRKVTWLIASMSSNLRSVGRRSQVDERGGTSWAGSSTARATRRSRSRTGSSRTSRPSSSPSCGAGVVLPHLPRRGWLARDDVGQLRDPDPHRPRRGDGWSTRRELLVQLVEAANSNRGLDVTELMASRRLHDAGICRAPPEGAGTCIRWGSRAQGMTRSEYDREETAERGGRSARFAYPDGAGSGGARPGRRARERERLSRSLSGERQRTVPGR
ncbi:VanZ family protein [Microbacterium barkeri]|uniref:VanZ family protein n=1 Tax=Microbacterium barkeri TaxID=33917 RepID=UPI00360D33EE